jgi:DNA-binding response OmpR family regulator
MLPQISGLEICRRIRALGRSTPVLFLTAKDTLDDRVSGLDAGADDYCLKPLRKSEFLARVHAVFRRSYRHLTEDCAQRDLMGYLFSEADYSVTFNGTTVVLTHKEFKLAVLLFENADRALSRNRLVSEVWGSNTEDFSRSLDVHISGLRRKLGLGATDSTCRLKPIYGYGYRLFSLAHSVNEN